MNESLQALLASARVWHARAKGAGRGASVPERMPVEAPPSRASPELAGGLAAGCASPEAPPGAVSTGWPALDAALPDAGWPLGTLVELLLPAHGVGELQLLLPALRTLCGAEDRWLLWIAPPHAPYPPALAQAGLEPARVLLVDAGGTQDRLWAMEQALHSRSCGAVLAWLDDADDRWLRRLKLAAEPGRTLAVLFRPAARRAQSSPAALRLVLEPHGDRLDVEMVKSRGGPRRVSNVLGLR